MRTDHLNTLAGTHRKRGAAGSELGLRATFTDANPPHANGPESREHGAGAAVTAEASYVLHRASRRREVCLAIHCLHNVACTVGRVCGAWLGCLPSQTTFRH